LEAKLPYVTRNVTALRVLSLPTVQDVPRKFTVLTSSSSINEYDRPFLGKRKGASIIPDVYIASQMLMLKRCLRNACFETIRPSSPISFSLKVENAEARVTISATDANMSCRYASIGGEGMFFYLC
jgi:hypothetical protein